MACSCFLVNLSPCPGTLLPSWPRWAASDFRRPVGRHFILTPTYRLSRIGLSSAVSRFLPSRVDHGQDARADRFRQPRPRVNHSLQFWWKMRRSARCAGAVLAFFPYFVGVVRVLPGVI